MIRLITTILLSCVIITAFALTRTHSAHPETTAKPLVVPAQADTHSIRMFSIVMKDLVFDRTTGKFYASIPSRAGSTGNSIAKIDPATGQIESTVFVGSEPGKLALSDDGHTLYVSLDGAGAVRRYDISTQTPLQHFTVNENSSEPLFVKDLAVAPGNPNLVAVARKNDNGISDFEGVAVYDQGVRRPLTTPRFTGSEFIAFSSSASTLYGSGSGGAGVQTMTVTAAGVSVVSSTSPSTFGGDLKFDNGFLYLPSGQVFNASTMALAGTFTLSNSLGTSQLEPDSSVGRTFFVTGQSAFSDTDSRTLTLQAFSQSTFVPLGSVDIPNVRGQITSLVRWGANGLAFGSTGGQFFIIQTTLIPSSEPVPSPTPTPFPSPTPTPTPTPTPGPGQLREVQIVAKDLVIDPSGTLLASVPSSAGVGGNSITPIDPVSNVVGQPVFVGSEPNKLAISDNGQTMYIGLDGAKAVRRFDVATRTPGLQFPVDSQGQLVPVDLAIAPGQPQTVAVARGSNPNDSSGGVALFDDGVQRANTTGFAHTINVLEYSASPLILYGHNNSNSEFGFRKMATTPCGISILSVKNELISGANEFKISGGRAFATGGRLADPEAGILLGTYDITNNVQLGIFGRAVLPEPATNRIYFFMADFAADFSPRTMLIRAYDMQTFLHVDTLALPNISGRPTAVVRWGTDGFAFRTTTNKVYLVQTSLIPSQSQPPAPVPTPTPPTYTLPGSVFNNFTLLPLPTITLQLSGGATGTTTTNADGSFAFTNLSFCTDFTVTPQQIENYTITPASLTITGANQNNPNLSTAVFQASPKLVLFPFISASAAEGNTLVLNVTRQGNISAAATVNFQTSDGTASDKSDYLAAVGTLRFDPNQATKQITIFLTDDVRDEPDETFNVTLSDPTGAFLGAPSIVPITIIDNDATNGTVNPVDDATFFVRQHYRDFLNRDPDAPGLAFWVNEITSCGSNTQCVEIKRINVSAAFFVSIEFQETGYLAYRIFKVAHGDATSPNVSGTVPVIRFREFLADARRIGEGVQVGVGNWEQQLENNKSAYALEFVSRQRFLNAFPPSMTADQFVSKLDLNAGGVLSASEKLQLVNLLFAAPADNTKRAVVLQAIAEDVDLRNAELNRAFVLMQYYGYLRRNPDDPQDVDFTGWRFWLDKLNQFNGNYIQAEMVKAFLSSVEYRQRFGP